MNRGNSLSDEFEKEVVRYQEKVNSSNPGARILKSQYEQAKKEGGALVKAVITKWLILNKLALNLKHWMTFNCHNVAPYFLVVFG